MPKSNLKGGSSISLVAWFKDLTYNEVHLFWMGVMAGMYAVRPKPRHEPRDHDKSRLKWDVNKWYWYGGYWFGYVTKAAATGAAWKMGYIRDAAAFVAGF